MCTYRSDPQSYNETIGESNLAALCIIPGFPSREMPPGILEEGRDDVMQETQLLSIFRLLVFGTPLPLPTPSPTFFLEGFQLFPTSSACVCTCAYERACTPPPTHTRQDRTPLPVPPPHLSVSLTPSVTCSFMYFPKV